MKYKDYPNIKQRIVGKEALKTFHKKLEEGFFDKYMSGNGLDIGFVSNEINKHEVVSVLPTATGVDLNYPGYNGFNLPFKDLSQDYVYGSHVLEHIYNRIDTLREWMRVIKVGGHLVLAVPHRDLYEKKLHKPSKWNDDHKVFITPALLLKEVEEALKPNSYRIRLLEDGDHQYSYHIPPSVHPEGQLEITLCLQKISPPDWTVE